MFRMTALLLQKLETETKAARKYKREYISIYSIEKGRRRATGIERLSKVNMTLLH